MIDKRSYRVVVFSHPRGPWRDTFAEAKSDAISQKLASYDRSRREWYLAVPVSIEVMTEQLPDPEPREPPKRRPGRNA